MICKRVQRLEKVRNITQTVCIAANDFVTHFELLVLLCGKNSVNQSNRVLSAPRVTVARSAGGSNRWRIRPRTGPDRPALAYADARRARQSRSHRLRARSAPYRCRKDGSKSPVRAPVVPSTTQSTIEDRPQTDRGPSSTHKAARLTINIDLQNNAPSRARPDPARRARSLHRLPQARHGRPERTARSSRSR